MTANQLTGKAYYPALDGLRGVAILLVLVYHNFGFIGQFYFGWLGVDLFFVLSGFLITDILMNTLGQPHFLRNFYMRRVLRIFPLYYLCLVFFLLIYPSLFTVPDFSYYKENQAWLWTYLQNWLYIFKSDDSVNILHHLWSLAVEEQFYLLWPLTILLVKQPKRLIVLLAFALLAVIALRYIVWEYKVENFAYFNLYTFSRIDGICIGSMLALIIRVNKDWIARYQALIVVSLALLNFAFFFFNQSKSYSLPYLAIAGYTTFAVMIAILVYKAVRQENRLIAVIFSNPVLKFFGKLSYGLYVYHWPVYLILKKPLTDFFQQRFTSLPLNLAVSVTATAAAIGLSWASFHFFEKHFLKLKKQYT